VSADSRQIYRDMPIGTAAPTREQRAAVPHHLVECLDPFERYSAARFAHDATAIVREIHARGKRAIVAGGTGFYIRALTGDVALAPQHDEALRARLATEARVHEPAFLHAWLALRDPARAAALEPNDTYRVVRALEVALAPQTARSDAGLTLVRAGIPFVKLFVDIPLAENDARIAARADAMLAAGFVEEAERIGADAVAASAVGYPAALAYLRGWCTLEEVRFRLGSATRRYARRQRAWFRSEPAVRWVERGEVEAAARELPGWS
jgi:tRNA dimethylallyltransferase